MAGPSICFIKANLYYFPKPHPFPTFNPLPRPHPLPVPLPLLLISLFSIFPLSALSLSSIGPQQSLKVIRYASGNFFKPLSPSPHGNASHVSNPGILAGFPGITAYESATAGLGSSPTEPPDVALAVGSGYVLQSVNGAIRVFRSKTRKPVTGVTDINQFFNATPFNRGGDFPIGDLLTDPRTFYDPLTKRFFVFIWGIPQSNYSRFPKDSSFQLLAVSRRPNPLKGFYYYKYNSDLMGFGDVHAETGPCPCYPDFQMVGFDYYGVQITSQSFSIESGSFVGIQFQVISKQDLVSGKKSPIAVRFDGSPKTSGYIMDSVKEAFRVQPAVVPFNYLPDMKNGGTQYFLSNYDIRGFANGVELWALTNTKSLRLSNPELRISRMKIFTESYTSMFPAAVQKNGSIPYTGTYSDSVSEVDVGLISMQQVVYGNGTLMGSFTTGVFDSSTKDDKTGIAYVAISPYISKKTGRVNGRRIGEGRFSIPGSWAFFPSIIFNKNKAMVVFALSGPDVYPSIGVFFIRRNPYRTQKYVVVFKGTEPTDGFSASPNYGGNGVSRWGDYFASCLDEEGNFWIAGETTLGGKRSSLVNWGTYIAKISGN